MNFNQTSSHLQSYNFGISIIILEVLSLLVRVNMHEGPAFDSFPVHRMRGPPQPGVRYPSKISAGDCRWSPLRSGL